MLRRREVFQNLASRCWSTLRLCRAASGPAAAPLTAEHYAVKRRDYAELTELDIQEFCSILSEGEGGGGAERVVTDAATISPHNTDWLGNLRGQSQLLLRPRSTREVSQILTHCNKRRLAVVPQGGNTGLVGGSVPVFDEIILSTSLMDKIISLDTTSGVLVCQAGCVLEALSNHLAEKGLMMPLDLGAKGSCQIGGNVSTNAGGLRVLRYGSLHSSVLGLEVVLADGTVLDSLSTLRKDNTGYDLKQLFIGAEGTLGVVTAVSVLTPPLPRSVNVAFMGCPGFTEVREVYATSKAMLGEILSAVEFMDGEQMEVVEKYLPLRNPLSPHPFYVLVETSGSNDQHDKEKLDAFLEHVMSKGLIEDGTVAPDISKQRAIWALRETTNEALLKAGVIYKYDISLPLDVMYDLVVDVRERCAGVAMWTIAYGHVGDCNLHLNIVGEGHSTELTDLLEPFIFDWTAQHGGSVSAEHGLGFKKAQYIYHSKSREAVLWMKRLKQLFDPKGILNPYKTLPSD